MPLLRDATDVIELPDRSPVDGSIAMTFSPDQNDPKLRYHRPCWSTTRSGSIALYLLEPFVLTTRPRFVHVPGFPLGLVARKIAEFMLPNVEAA